MAKLLIENKADVSLIDKDMRTPFVLACFHGNLSILHILLDSTERDFNINAKDKAGRNGLMWASYLDHLSIVNYLQSFPAPP